MNERIKQLAEQAGYTKDMFGVGHWDMLECQKFAELIAKQCADVCQQVTNNGMFDGNQQYASAYCRDEIKRYFGVKE